MAQNHQFTVTILLWPNRVCRGQPHRHVLAAIDHFWRSRSDYHGNQAANVDLPVVWIAYKDARQLQRSGHDNLHKRVSRRRMFFVHSTRWWTRCRSVLTERPRMRLDRFVRTDLQLLHYPWQSHCETKEQNITLFASNQAQAIPFRLLVRGVGPRHTTSSLDWRSRG